MQRLNRPVAQTVAMLVDFTVTGHAYQDLRIEAVPDTIDGQPVTVFSAPDKAPNKKVVVYEPHFGYPKEYNGIDVSFMKNKASLLEDNFRGPDVANIAGQLVEFLAHPV